MKSTNKLTLLLILFLSCSTAFAQEVTTVVESIAEIGDENGTVLTTKINRVELKDILKEWKGKMKDYDGDVDIKKEIATAKEVKIESIDVNEIEVVAEVRELSKTQKQFLVMFIKNGVSISSTSDLSAFTAAKNIVRNFANELSKEGTEEYQETQIKALEELEDDLEDTKKDKEKAEEDIEGAKEDIEKAKEEIKEAEELIKKKNKEISENIKKQEKLLKKVGEQKTVVNGAKNEMELFK